MAIVKGAGGIDLITYPIGGGFVIGLCRCPNRHRVRCGDAGWNALAIPTP